MKAPLFLKNKITRLLNCNGVEFEFKIITENEYHEKIESDELIKIIGIYHETTMFKTQMVTDGNVTRSENSPMILCLFEDAEKINVGSILNYADKIYTVVSVENVQNYNIACEIHLDEVVSE